MNPLQRFKNPEVMRIVVLLVFPQFSEGREIRCPYNLHSDSTKCIFSSFTGIGKALSGMSLSDTNTLLSHIKFEFTVATSVTTTMPISVV